MFKSDMIVPTKGDKIKPMTDNKAEAVNIKPPKKITADYLHNAGLYYLQRFAASSLHFRRVMMRKIDRSCHYHTDQDKAACTALLDALIDDFKRSGLLDDAAYVQGSVASLRRKGLSARAIEARLAAKSVAAHDIRASLARHADHAGDPDQDFIAALRFARKKRIGPFGHAPADEEDGTHQDKAMAAMARAGFSYETARKALATRRDDADNILIHQA
jgi:regulatory protein